MVLMALILFVNPFFLLTASFLKVLFLFVSIKYALINDSSHWLLSGLHVNLLNVRDDN